MLCCWRNQSPVRIGFNENIFWALCTSKIYHSVFLHFVQNQKSNVDLTQSTCLIERLGLLFTIDNPSLLSTMYIWFNGIYNNCDLTASFIQTVSKSTRQITKGFWYLHCFFESSWNCFIYSKQISRLIFDADWLIMRCSWMIYPRRLFHWCEIPLQYRFNIAFSAHDFSFSSFAILNSRLKVSNDIDRSEELV